MSLIIRYYALMISIFQFVTFNKHVQVFEKFIIYSMFFTPSVSIFSSTFLNYPEFDLLKVIYLCMYLAFDIH